MNPVSLAFRVLFPPLLLSLLFFCPAFSVQNDPPPSENACSPPPSENACSALVYAICPGSSMFPPLAQALAARSFSRNDSHTSPDLLLCTGAVNRSHVTLLPDVFFTAATRRLL